VTGAGVFIDEGRMGSVMATKEDHEWGNYI